MSTPTAPAHSHRRFTEHLPTLAEAGPLIALVIACIFFISQSNRFLSFQNLSLILQQTMVVAVIAIGQTLIYFDLEVTERAPARSWRERFRRAPRAEPLGSGP